MFHSPFDNPADNPRKPINPIVATLIKDLNEWMDKKADILEKRTELQKHREETRDERWWGGRERSLSEDLDYLYNAERVVKERIEKTLTALIEKSDRR